jgi:3-oxoacyl-[acyl-carrier protein] reductase
MEGKVALVTGASRGIGRAIAIQLATDGFFVAINYLANKQAAEAVYGEIRSKGGTAMLLPFDVSIRDDVFAAIRRLDKEKGTVDTLVNNAGIIRDQPLVRMREQDWQQVLATDLFGVYHCTKAVVKTWAGRRQGRRIINIISIAGELGNAYQSNYCAAKGGVLAFTKAVARELAPKGVTVNAIAPGVIATDATAHLPVNEVKALVPLGRVGRPEEVAHAVSFLASDRANYITGQVIRVNGGQHM